MFIIFGIKRKAARLATVFALCGYCHNPAAQVVTRIRTYFSLFFIPVIPLGTKYRTTCTLCGTTSAIGADEAEQAVQAQATHQAGGGGGDQTAPPTWDPPPAPPAVQAPVSPAAQPPAAQPPAGPQAGSA